MLLDRGYEALNVYAHLLKNGFYFLIRLKDTDSNGITASYRNCGETFDIDFDKIITKHTPYHTENKEDYKVITDRTTFDFMEKAGDELPMQFRIVRFQLDNRNFECAATNLPRDEFPPEKLKVLYARRWGIELFYRDLKYTLGMNNLHSRKTNSIKHEIYSNLIMHNFCRINSSFAEVKKNKDIKSRKVNFSTAVTIYKAFLRGLCPAENVICLISKNLLPEIPGRSFELDLKPKSCTHFCYRAA